MNAAAPTSPAFGWRRVEPGLYRREGWSASWTVQRNEAAGVNEYQWLGMPTVDADDPYTASPVMADTLREAQLAVDRLLDAADLPLYLRSLYVDYADELGGGLTDDDLDPEYYEQVADEACALGLPWPPPPDADDAGRLWDEHPAHRPDPTR